jgi:hypothetical protein
MSNAPAFHDHRINTSTPLHMKGIEGAETALEQAHALLCVMTIDEEEFSALNPRIQYRAIEAIEHLVAIAHYHLATR